MLAFTVKRISNKINVATKISVHLVSAESKMNACRVRTEAFTGTVKWIDVRQMKTSKECY